MEVLSSNFEFYKCFPLCEYFILLGMAATKHLLKRKKVKDSIKLESKR